MLIIFLPLVHLGLFACSQMFHFITNENIVIYLIYVVSLCASKGANKKINSKDYAVFQVTSYSGINLFQAYRNRYLENFLF